MARTQREMWDEFNEILLETVDVETECKEWGLEFTGSVSPSGFAECRAVDRDDKHPSAAVNVMTGYYKDLGPGASMPFFRLGVEYGPYNSYYECQQALAKKYKVKIPKSTKGSSFHSKIRYKKWSSMLCAKICKELGISESTLLMCGGKMTVTGMDDIAVSFDVYDSALGFDAPQKGVVSINAMGGKLQHYKGKGALPEMLRTISAGKSGLMNKHAIAHWHEAKVIYKVEGLTDMLVLQDQIPEDLRNTHLVVTNSDGCDAVSTAFHFADLARDKVVVVIHDGDEPGQFGVSGSRTGGAIRWEGALKKKAKAVLNLQLFETLEAKKGPDIRDWFNEDGNDYTKLADMVAKSLDWTEKGKVTPDGSVSTDTKDQNLKEHQIILRALDLIVLGHTKDGTIQVFNAAKCRKFAIKDIDRFSFARQLVHIGQAANDLIADPSNENAPEEMFDSNDVRIAIAREAGGKELSRTNTVGIGIWESGGRLSAVGAGEWLSINGGVDVYNTPTIDDKIVDFGELEEAWYDTDLLYPFLEQAKSPEFCAEHLKELAAHYDKWDNHAHPMAGTMLACLSLATWAQSVWEWRPWVALTGESASGKTLLYNWISQYFGKLCVSTSDATAAGIRNTIHNSSRILMIDEFETGEHRTQILAMLMGSNRRGNFGTSLRSNAAQASVTNEYQLLPWFAATEMKRDKQTEANRYLTFELKARANPAWIDIMDDPDDLTVLRNKSIAVIMRIWQRAKHLNSVIMRSLGAAYTRQSESYALISAIYGACNNYTEEQVIDYHNSMMEQLSEQTIVESEDTEQQLALNAILDSHIRTAGGKTVPVSELLSAERAEKWDQDPEQLLRNHGIRRMPYSSLIKQADWHKHKHQLEDQAGSYVFFNVSSSGMIRKQLLRGTEHDRQDLTTILSRLPGAFKAMMRTTSVSKGVMVPASLCFAVDSAPAPEKSEFGEDLGEL